MPNDTLAANAAPMSIDRRLFLASGSAVAVFGALRTAKAETSPDADVFAAVSHVRELMAARTAAADREDALEELLPGREALVGLRVRESDAEIFDTQTPVGGTLTHAEVVMGANVLMCIRTLVPKQQDNPLLRPLFARVDEANEANKSWSGFLDSERKRLGCKEAEDTYNRCADAVDDAALALLDLRPRTAAGVREIVRVLVDLNTFERTEDRGLARLLLETPALDREA